MVDGWLNLIKFVTSQFGLPGSLAVAIAGYLIYILREERAAHVKTRDKIDEINEKRIEFTKAVLEAILELKNALSTVSTAIGGNQKALSALTQSDEARSLRSEARRGDSGGKEAGK